MPRVTRRTSTKPTRKPETGREVAGPAADLQRQLKIQHALYEIATAASAATDMQAFYADLHRILAKLIYARNFFIALYDEKTDLISWPYRVDTLDPHALPDTQPQKEPGITAWIVTHGQALANADGSLDRALSRGELRLIGTASDSIGIPLVSDGKTIGALVVQSYTEAHRYAPQDIDLLRFAGQHISTALVRRRLAEETRQRNSELQVINTILEGLSSKLDLQAILDVVGHQLRKVFGTNTLGIWLADPATGKMTFHYMVSRGERLRVAPQAPSGFSGRVLRTGKTMVVNRNLAEQARRYGARPFTDGPLPKSGLYVPIMARSKPIGVVVTWNFDREDAYDESTIRLLEIVAGHMGAALENARLFNETQRLLGETEQRNAELGAINSIQQGLATELNFQAIVDLVGDKLRRVLNSGNVSILWYDASTNLVHHVYQFEHGRRLDEFPPHPPTSKAWQRVIQKRQTVIINTEAEKADLGITDIPGTSHSLSMVMVPILGSERVVGAVFVENYDREHAFSENHVRLVQTVTASMGVALENARLFAETQRLLAETEQSNSELAIINSVQSALATRLDIHEIYDAVGEQLVQIFDHQDVGVYAADPRTRQMSMEYGFEQGKKFEPFAVPMNSLYEHVVRANRTLVFNGDFEPFAARFSDYRVPRGELPKSALIVPVPAIKEGEPAVFLTVFDVEGRKVFSPSEVRLLETLASSLGIALENARLWEKESLYRKALQRELEIGRDMQADFLPESLPQAAGWDIAAALMPAREVAGDFYDAFQLPDGNIALVIADVCDKGVGAALFMTLFRSLIRITTQQQYAPSAGSGTAQWPVAEGLQRAVRLTNDYIAGTHGKSGMFATLFFGILDPRLGRLAYINGGHEPPVIVEAGRVREALPTTGPAVGAISGASFEVGVAELHRGDMFLGYTDGVPDCQDPAGEFFGFVRLRDFLREDTASSQALVDGLQAKLREYVGAGTQFDDIALLAMKRN
jgi:serine phosphatase RsbU (regulator of sigma subunit)